MKPLRAWVVAGALSALLAGHSAAQPAHTPGQIGSLPLLLSTEEARKDLRLTPSQNSAIDSLRTRFRDKARAIVTAVTPDPTDRARAANELAGLRSSTNRQALALLNPGQKVALARLEHSYIGPSLLVLPEIQKTLNLSESQKRRIAELSSDWAAAVEDVNDRFEAGEMSPHKRRALLRKDRETRNDRFLAVLNASQKSAFHAMGSSFRAP